MKKKFSVEQIVSVLKQAEVGVPVAELIRKVGITEQTYYRWKAKYAGLEVDQVRQVKQPKDENTRPKQLVAKLTLDKTIVAGGAQKKVVKPFRRRPLVKYLEQATCREAACCGASSRAVSSNRAEPGMGHGLRLRSTLRWKAISFADHRGYLHA